jgi:4-hydroxy-2-oxoheptanedioate aldolase
MARFGTWSMLPDPIAVEALGRSGADFVGLDAQHGAHGFESLARAIQLLDTLGVEALVRLSELELALIPRVLDLGASGVIVAMVEAPETAARAVELARYQPEGTRSYGGRRFGLSPEPDDLREARPAVWAMVETAAAVQRLDEIAATPGLTGLFVGPVDLALALGVTGPAALRLSAELAGNDPRTDEEAAWLDALAEVVRAAHDYGLEATTFCLGAADARHWAAAGFDRVVVSADVTLLRAAVEGELRAARA